MKTNETYLGDGLYASFDGFQIRLWTMRGPHVVHEVFLETGVLAAFERFIALIRSGAEE